MVRLQANSEVEMPKRTRLYSRHRFSVPLYQKPEHKSSAKWASASAPSLDSIAALHLVQHRRRSA